MKKKNALFGTSVYRKIILIFSLSILLFSNTVLAGGNGLSSDASGPGLKLPSGVSVSNSAPTSSVMGDAGGNGITVPAGGGVQPSTSADPTKIVVTERVPGGQCTCIAEGSSTQGEAACGTPENRKYECTVPQGLAGFQDVFAKVIRYFIYIVLLLGVLGIVGLGMAWAFAGGDDVKMKTTLKHWGMNVFVGLILLFLFSYILMALAPWVFQS